jgi:Holliday junction DNA helicase RuvA
VAVIGRLQGVLVQKQAPRLLLDVQGVGYEVEAPMTTFYNLPPEGSRVTLLTHLVTRDDGQHLYGFANEAERALFRHLIRCNGIGARIALAILSGMTADTFIRCIREGDAASLTRLPGVGKKTAERLLIEMRDRLGDWEYQAAVSAHTSASPDAVSDAVSALVALGYKSAEATRMVRAVADASPSSPSPSSEQLIRLALQKAVK